MGAAHSLRPLAVSLSFLAAFACHLSRPAIPMALPPCSLVDTTLLTAEWDPRSLAGQYRVEWITQTDSGSRSERFRLFLWPTSMRDSSPRRHTKPRVDTTLAPIYGQTAPDTGVFTPKRIAALRAATDPIYPPLLLAAPLLPAYRVSPREFTVLMWSTQNSRGGVGMTDGTATAIFVRAADRRGFRGTFGPGGFGPPDRGYYCAWRVPL